MLILTRKSMGPEQLKTHNWTWRFHWRCFLFCPSLSFLFILAKPERNKPLDHLRLGSHCSKNFC